MCTVQQAAEMAVRAKLKEVAKQRLQLGQCLEAVDFMDDGLQVQLKVQIDHETGLAPQSYKADGLR